MNTEAEPKPIPAPLVLGQRTGQEPPKPIACRAGRNPAGTRPSRRGGCSRSCLLGHPHHAGGGELPDHRGAGRAFSRAGECAGDGQAGGGAGEPAARLPAGGEGRGDRAGVPADHRRRALPRAVRGRRDPGRGRHVDQHERQRGDRQRGAGDDGRGARALCGAASERRRQHGAVDQRRVSDGAAARGDPSARRRWGGRSTSWRSRSRPRRSSSATC